MWCVVLRPYLMLHYGVGVGDVPQEQRVPRHGSACAATVFLLDDAGEAVNRKSPRAYFDKGADDGSYHVA